MLYQSQKLIKEQWRGQESSKEEVQGHKWLSNWLHYIFYTVDHRYNKTVTLPNIIQSTKKINVQLANDVGPELSDHDGSRQRFVTTDISRSMINSKDEEDYLNKTIVCLMMRAQITFLWKT